MSPARDSTNEVTSVTGALGVGLGCFLVGIVVHLLSCDWFRCVVSNGLVCEHVHAAVLEATVDETLLDLVQQLGVGQTTKGWASVRG